MSQDAKIIVGIGVATLVILIVGAIFLSSSGSSSDATATTKVDANRLATSTTYQTGPKDAPVQFVEFGDYQCPACGALYPVVKELQKEYGKKMNFVFKNFPLISVHKNAMISAQYAVAAGKQGKFWQMHDILYEKQDDWGETDAAKAFFDKYAKSLGLNVSKLDADAQAKDVIGRINTDVADGNNLSVNATPTFYINQVKYTGQYDLDSLKAAIDKLLK